MSAPMPAEVWWPLNIRLEHTGGQHLVPYHYWLLWHHQFLLARVVS